MLNVVMLSVANKPFLLCVFILNVIMLSVVVMSVVAPAKSSFDELCTYKKVMQYCHLSMGQCYKTF